MRRADAIELGWALVGLVLDLVREAFIRSAQARESFERAQREAREWARRSAVKVRAPWR